MAEKSKSLLTPEVALARLASGEEIPPEERQLLKAIAFALPYSQGADTVRRRMKSR
jgi:hypothetical protein